MAQVRTRKDVWKMDEWDTTRPNQRLLCAVIALCAFAYVSMPNL